MTKCNSASNEHAVECASDNSDELCVPVHGILQTGANHECLEVLGEILESHVNVRQSIYLAKMALLQEKLPDIAYVLAGCPDTVPTSVCKVLEGLMNM